MNERILANVEQSALEAEFEAACNDPKGLDCGFETQRCSTGFANFGFDPDKAAEMREKELARIAAEMEAEEPVYDESDDDWDDLVDDQNYDRIEDIDEYEDEEDYDRFADHLDLDEDEDE